jgi:predicted aspartyl protease
MNFKLTREQDTGLFTVTALLNGVQRVKLILDTGATVTTLDSNILYIVGCRPEDSLGTALVETASGIIVTELFEIAEFKLFGITLHDFVVQAHDFLEHGVTSDYNGLLGLDFFEGQNFCINMGNNELSINQL